MLAGVLRQGATALASQHPDSLCQPDAHAVLYRIKLSLGGAGQFAAARESFAALTETSSTRLGPDYPDTLTALSNLASWRGAAGDAAGAAAAFEALLADQLRVLGPDHPDTLTTCNNLAYSRHKVAASS